MSTKLYVGNLSYEFGEEELKNVFGEHGDVKSAKIITDYDTGRSKGFAFVEMGSSEEAQSCIDNLDNKEVNGRGIRVSIAKERTSRSGGGGGGGRRW